MRVSHRQLIIRNTLNLTVEGVFLCLEKLKIKEFRNKGAIKILIQNQICILAVFYEYNNDEVSYF